MAVRASDLRPYLSLVLGETPGAPADLGAVLGDLERLVCGEARGPRAREGGAVLAASRGVRAGFFHYREQRPPAWLEGTAVQDVTNHLVVAVCKGGSIAVCVSDPRWRGPVLDGFGDGSATGLQRVRPVSASRLNAAFVKGRARTLWLSGAHRRSEIRADSKILSGVDLRYALDPLADQTFYFTSARSDHVLPHRTSPVGVTPRSSRVWLGMTRSWDEFLAGVEAVLDTLAATTGSEDAPLPVLAVPCGDAEGVSGAFDAALIAPGSGEPADPEEAAFNERWTWRSSLRVLAAADGGFRADVALDGEALGCLDVAVDLADPSRPECSASIHRCVPGKEGPLQEAARLCGKRAWLRVWYDSGHTLGDGQLYRVRHRDLRFDGFRWADFGTHRVDLEKPSTLAGIGAERSLFCWIHRNRPGLGPPEDPCGWLACDDGAGEKADFIHLSEATPAGLSLIHVKAAHSASARREIAVSAFEVVVSQAVKNLRYLEPELLGEGLEGGLGSRIRDWVWRNRGPAPPADMLHRLRRLGASIEKRVVVLQPHLRRRALSTPGGRRPMSTREAMLHALLLSADTACRGRGATLQVVAAS